MHSPRAGSSRSSRSRSAESSLLRSARLRRDSALLQPSGTTFGTTHAGTRKLWSLPNSPELPVFRELPEENEEEVEAEEDVNIAVPESSEEEEGDNFRRSLQFDMKGLIGDAVGNMSISPSSRDVVLAARRGLFIIDLENPFQIPRFLPQGGTWDVADVQWNPHPARKEYIVSTSSQKLLIWNLLTAGKSSIEHVLHAHYRAITDINWHTFEADLVVSTGIDSWLWAWDLREVRRPAFGMCAFNAGGTQVKWNRHDANILASSHANEILIWDRRKGSLPIHTISAHTSKIYGIDWSTLNSKEIVTCSLDRTIKTWDIDSSSSMSSTLASQSVPKSSIRTTYPVWRARHLPFGKGILSLAQRGETALEMYANDRKGVVERFEGHTDVVKEFVWRHSMAEGDGGDGGERYQLITWSKDRTLRFWPIEPDLVQRVGGEPPPALSRGRRQSKSSSSRSVTVSAFQDPSQPSHQEAKTVSFRNPPHTSTYSSSYAPAMLSAPVVRGAGSRAILAEVRASLPPRGKTIGTGNTAVPYPPVDIEAEAETEVGLEFMPTSLEGMPFLLEGSELFKNDAATTITTAASSTVFSSPSPAPQPGAVPSTMSRGSAATSRARRGLGGGLDQLAWIQSVKLSGGRRSASSGTGTGSGSNSADVSLTRDGRESSEERSISGKKDAREEGREGITGGSGSLQEEITTVLNKLAAHKIQLEKADLTKRRTCTLGMHGPWGESSSVFIRVTFTFPKSYPSAVFPEGTPLVDLERNPLISVGDRTFILRRLRAIRERKRPCLEACLRFLLFARTDEDDLGVGAGISLPLDSDSDSDSDSQDGNGEDKNRKARDVTIALLRNNKNLAEPITTQGSFGPNGELVCFFRAAPRIPRDTIRDNSNTSGRTDASKDSQNVEESPLPSLQPPSRVSDAVRRLTILAADRTPTPKDSRRLQGHGPDRILRLMTDLLTVTASQQQPRRLASASHSRSVDPGQRNAGMYAPKRSTVVMCSTLGFAGSEKVVAEGYVFTSAGGLKDICETNAAVARACRRFEHERVFLTLTGVFSVVQHGSAGWWMNENVVEVVRKVVNHFLQMFRDEKDIQMLGMVSMLTLQAFSLCGVPDKSMKTAAPTAPTLKLGLATDYFSLMRRSPSSPVTPSSAWALRSSLPVSPTTPAPPLSSSNSSKGSGGTGSNAGSWSSLFNAGTMRQFMTGVGDTIKDGLTTPTETGRMVWPIASRGSGSPQKREKAEWGIPEPSLASSEGNEKRIPPSFSPRRRRVTPKTAKKTGTSAAEKKVVVFEESEPSRPVPLLLPEEKEQLVVHVHIYAELLFRWQLFHKRLELLKSVSDHLGGVKQYDHSIGAGSSCPDCDLAIPPNTTLCPGCRQSCKAPSCSICRLPVKGLSQSCMRCFHISHLSCWRQLGSQMCPSGCGCFCG